MEKTETTKRAKRAKAGGRQKGRNDALLNRLCGEDGAPIWSTTAETARLLGMHTEQVLRLARAGKLPGKKFGYTWRFRTDLLMKVE